MKSTNADAHQIDGLVSGQSPGNIPQPLPRQLAPRAINVLGLKEAFGDRQSDAKASCCEAGVARPNPWDRCRHDKLVFATWRSARQRRAVTNHDLIDAALGVLDHHAKSLLAPQTLHPEALCHTFQPPGSDQREPDQPNVLRLMT